MGNKQAYKNIRKIHKPNDWWKPKYIASIIVKWQRKLNR
jgi:hypothetical protein